MIHIEEDWPKTGGQRGSLGGSAAGIHAHPPCRGGGRGTVLMAEKYLLFNLLNIQRDVTEKE